MSPGRLNTLFCLSANYVADCVADLSAGSQQGGPQWQPTIGSSNPYKALESDKGLHAGTANNSSQGQSGNKSLGDTFAAIVTISRFNVWPYLLFYGDQV